MVVRPLQSPFNNYDGMMVGIVKDAIFVRKCGKYMSSKKRNSFCFIYHIRVIHLFRGACAVTENAGCGSTPGASTKFCIDSDEWLKRSRVRIFFVPGKLNISPIEMDQDGDEVSQMVNIFIFLL